MEPNPSDMDGFGTAASAVSGIAPSLSAATPRATAGKLQKWYTLSTTTEVFIEQIASSTMLRASAVIIYSAVVGPI